MLVFDVELLEIMPAGGGPDAHGPGGHGGGHGGH